MSEKKTCFVISPIGEEGSDTREHADKLLEYVIERAVEPMGYEPVRADQIDEPGMITSQIIEKVVESPLVIADLTNSNANVFYELAVRHVIQKPIIQLTDKNEDIPFDVAGSRVIKFDLNDVATGIDAVEEIKSQIKSIESDSYTADTPISRGMNVMDLRERGDTELADIMESISELQTNIASIQNKLGDPEELFPEEYRKGNIRRERTVKILEHELRSLKDEYLELTFLLQDKDIELDDEIESEIARVNDRIHRVVDLIDEETVPGVGMIIK